MNDTYTDIDEALQEQALIQYEIVEDGDWYLKPVDFIMKEQLMTTDEIYRVLHSVSELTKFLNAK